MKRSFWFILVGFGLLGIAILNEMPEETAVSTATITPDWSAITAWPNNDSESTEAIPDPNRQITAIVLDDSGSMGADIEPAKAAILAALDAMSDTDRVAVIALNAGVIQPFADVAEARQSLPGPLRRVGSDGSTPLTAAIQRARGMLEAEAARARAFGTFRIIVTTDGAADDGARLTDEIEDIARVTPIQIATIGIGISGRHVLRRAGLAAFVDVDDVQQLADALKAAIAESQSFDAAVSFEEG